MKYNFPKVDLHLHLDGSFEISTIWQLAQNQGVKMPDDTLQGYRDWTNKCVNSGSVNEYLEAFAPPLQVMQDKDSLALVTKELIEKLADQGLVYAEIRFAPQLHTQKGMSQEEAIEAVLEGRRQALLNKPSIKIGIICCLMCVGKEEINRQANIETASIVHKYLNKGVVCLDLAGAEGFQPVSAFAPIFEIAKKNNVPIICHAGDSQDWTACKDAIEMGAKRLGHGHHIYENPELCRYAAEHNIALEICPTSNVQCQTRPSYKMHPAWNLYQMGIPVTINTDNMTMSQVCLDDEYDHCLEEMGFEYEDLILMNINSIKYSFLPDEDKKEIIAKMEKALEEVIK